MQTSDAASAPATGERRFQAYNVGLVKTGTTSMAGIFSRYRSQHEFMMGEATGILGDCARGVAGKRDLRTFVLERDRNGALEMDSASFNFAYVDILIEEFPRARFIFTIRDCYSWLDSVLNTAVRLGSVMPGWMIDQAERARIIPFTSQHARSREELVRNLPEVIDHALALWAHGNRSVLAALPPERALVLRTGEISQSIERVARFVGVPPETLRPERSHLYQAPQRIDVLRDVDHQFLRMKFKQYCADIMQEYFPGYVLNHFLAGRVFV